VGWRGTLALGIALLAAAVYLYRDVTTQHPDATWQVLFEEPRPTPPGAGIKHLLDLDPATVTAIRLRHGDEQREVRRSGDNWQGANNRDVTDFLQALQDLAEIMPLEVAAGDLGAHGLDPPQSIIELERSGAAPLVLLVGGHNPPATAVYVQLGRGGPVVLTGALLLWDLDKATRTFAAAG
jgi:hypothetical protein